MMILLHRRVISGWVLALVASTTHGLTTMTPTPTTTTTTETTMINRRTCIEVLQGLSLCSVFLSSPNAALAATTPIPQKDGDSPVITDKVFFDVRVARQDGSTYVRDDMPNDDPATPFENRVLTVRLVFGLFGTLAPHSVEEFLKYIVAPSTTENDNDVDNPYPSYSRSTFTSLDQRTGVLQGGYIPSLRLQELSGSTALTYGSRVLPAPLWIDRPPSSLAANQPRLSHTTKGLLTHRTLDPLPSFGITTRACPDELDATHTIFGQVLWDDATVEWFQQLQDLPTYQLNRPADSNNNSNDVVGEVATSVFKAQRDFFRGAAQSVGDTRVTKLYEGKLLRRMEVMQVGKL